MSIADSDPRPAVAFPHYPERKRGKARSAVLTKLGWKQAGYRLVRGGYVKEPRP